MSERDNSQIVQGMFASFGQGNLQGVLDVLADDVDWMMQGPAQIPYTGPRRGRDQVLQFCMTIGQSVEFEQFEAREFIAQGDTVVVLGHVKARARKTGRPFDHDWAMVFTLRDGKVVRYRNYEDTYALAEAFREA